LAGLILATHINRTLVQLDHMPEIFQPPGR